MSSLPTEGPIRRIKMKKSEHLKYCKKIADVLGYDRLHNLNKIQRNSLNNQLNDLIEKFDFVVEKVTDEAIIGRYELVTLYIYPDEFVELEKHLKFNN